MIPTVPCEGSDREVEGEEPRVRCPVCEEMVRTETEFWPTRIVPHHRLHFGEHIESFVRGACRGM